MKLPSRFRVLSATRYVYRRAARYVCITIPPGRVTYMFDNLNWEPLEVKRRHERIGMLCRIQYSLVDTFTDRYLQVSGSCTRGSTKFFQERITGTTYSNIFPRTVRDWNRFRHKQCLRHPWTKSDHYSVCDLLHYNRQSMMYIVLNKCVCVLFFFFNLYIIFSSTLITTINPHHENMPV